MTDKLKAWCAEMAKTPGATWRILSHRPSGAFEVQNEGIFDELVVDHWLHIEHMDERAWMIRVGEMGIWVDVQGDGEVIVRIMSQAQRAGD